MAATAAPRPLPEDAGPRPAPDPFAEQRAAIARGDPKLGRPLGSFRNTYYNFPQARHYDGKAVTVFDARCAPIARVPLGFHDALCVQGSGQLADGRTLSFARRGCRCARRCPRTAQRICFEALKPERYPWGRGAAGQAIFPLWTVAVDSDVIPLGTSLFIPEYLGLPRDLEHPSSHDGCFIAQDRGIKVRGKHVDVFTGEEALTRLWNRLLPSNRGVTVFADSPFCEQAVAAPPRVPSDVSSRGERQSSQEGSSPDEVEQPGGAR